MSTFEIDTLQIQFINHSTDDSFIYFMGYDQGDDYTSPDEAMGEMTEENRALINDLRERCYRQ
jgi:hypothetical protein